MCGECRRAARSVQDEIAAHARPRRRSPATVIPKLLRKDGYAGSITILKDHLQHTSRPFLARAYPGTSYLPSEIARELLSNDLAASLGPQ